MRQCSSYCEAEEDVTNNGYYVQDFVWQLPNLKSFEIELSIPCVDEDEGVWPEIRHAEPLVEAVKELAGMSKVTAIKVFKDYGEEDMLWGCWSEAEGWHAPAEVEYEEDLDESEEEEEDEGASELGGLP